MTPINYKKVDIFEILPLSYMNVDLLFPSFNPVILVLISLLKLSFCKQLWIFHIESFSIMWIVRWYSKTALYIMLMNIICDYSSPVHSWSKHSWCIHPGTPKLEHINTIISFTNIWKVYANFPYSWFQVIYKYAKSLCHFLE